MVDKTALGAIILAVIAIISTIPGMMDSDKVYYGTDGNSVTCKPMECDKLSASNLDNKKTRCYFNDGTKDTYKICNDGWIKFEKPSGITELNNTLISDKEQIYLLCEKRKDVDWISECEILGENKTINIID